MKPPRIVIPGLNRGIGVQPGPGVLVGRPRGGKGALQLLRQEDLKRMGLVTRRSISQQNQAGFTFQVNGVPSDNEFVGQGSWGKDVTFHNGDANNHVVSLTAAAGTPAMRMLASDLSDLGTITWAAGGFEGTVAWVTDPYVHPAGALMLLYCPTPADANLSGMSGRVVGYV